MSVLTLTKTLSPNTAVSVTCKFIYGTNYYYERLNQYKLPTVNGTEIVYDSGPTKVCLNLVLKDVSKTDGKALEAYIRDTLIFSLNTFTISAVTGLDLGQGDNTQILLARYPNSSLEGVFSFVAPQKYDINLPITYIWS